MMRGGYRGGGRGGSGGGGGRSGGGRSGGGRNDGGGGGRGGYRGGRDGGRRSGGYPRQQWRPNSQGSGGGAMSESEWHGGGGDGSQSEWSAIAGLPGQSVGEMGPTRGGWHGGHGRGGGEREGRRDQSSESQRGKEPTIPANAGPSGPGGGSYSTSPSEYVPRSHNGSKELAASSSSSLENADRVVPFIRPDKGGTVAIRRLRLLVNHFPVNFNPQSIIRHYDVDIKQEALPKHGRPVKISKSTLAMVRDKLFTDEASQFPLPMTAYDGEKNIFSAVPLPTGSFKVELSEGEDMKVRTFLFTIKLVNELKVCKLKDYFSGNLLSIPRDIMQGMDVVMKEHPGRHRISVGRSFHSVEAHVDDDLGHGITASRGFKQSLKPTSQGLALCLDYCVLSFHKRLSVIDFLKEHVDGFDLNNFRQSRRAVESVLKDLKVTVTHRITKQKYVIAGLTRDDTRHLEFCVEDPNGNAPPRDVRLVEYFWEKYNKNIMHQDIPCLELGKNNRKNHVPMEFCVLVDGQIYPKERLDRDAAVLLKNMSLAKPICRQNTICNMVQATDGPCGGGIVRNFGMDVITKMTEVVGRVIGPPELKLGTPSGRLIPVTVDKDKCQWNLVGKGVVEGIPIDRWAVLDFSYYEKNARYRLNNQFIQKLIARCESLGIRMEKPLFYETARMQMFSNVDRLHELLERVNDQAYAISRGRLQILLCVMSGKDPGYKHLKWISETKVGILTQCFLSSAANNPKGNDQYLANLALKINAKLGGSNVELGDQFPYFEGKNHVMFMGADVNHPGANRTSPSIAAVVATVNWPAANRYAARVRPQDSCSEKILNFGGMCLELVESYSLLNKVKPEKIVIFRDGVSEGQFDMVLNEELMDIKGAFQSINYTPTITFIVAQKRHLTRLFPASARDGGITGNVPPGTVVDTTIVHPFEFDFYLCSHYGSIGTSKPTHYYVLWDEHGLSSDQWQKLIYNMCFTFARCTKPVSLVPPVYYADLVAYRGRLYHDAVTEGRSPSSVASSSSSRTSSSLSVPSSWEDRFFALHADLENIMFFV